ncbi:MAG TPA: secondary thiamine-phosphate synthase enzyme YjbQ [bacterium]|nr:secondary thiamine-phosphate synthase enzyme YjbQ [bacterium]HPP29436.1 secondary thiamine-phosphate synthase enzyme YjbQ [bacterium]
MERITVKTTRRQEFIEITHLVEGIVKKTGVKSGICCVYVPHTTCGLTINENADPSVKADILSKLEKLVPENDRYSHSEGNSDAHIKSSILGHSLSILVEDGSLQLGTWQGIFLCEFDGPRTRDVWIKVI